MTPRRHVTAGELMDLVDGCASAEAQAHAAACPACREQVASLDAAIALARADLVPEPSPLFWEHFSARVSEAVRQEPEARSRWGRPVIARWWAVSGVAAAVVVFVIAVWPVGRSGRFPVPRAVTVPPTAAASTGAVARDDRAVPGEGEAAWARVAMLAGELLEAGDDLPVLDPEPGTAERAVDELSGDEQRELARLLAAELTRHPG